MHLCRMQTESCVIYLVAKYLFIWPSVTLNRFEEFTVAFYCCWIYRLNHRTVLYQWHHAFIVSLADNRKKTLFFLSASLCHYWGAKVNFVLQGSPCASRIRRSDRCALQCGYWSNGCSDFDGNSGMSRRGERTRLSSWYCTNDARSTRYAHPNTGKFIISGMHEVLM